MGERKGVYSLTLKYAHSALNINELARCLPIGMGLIR